jgi:small-conductance mechanosensitive channel
MDDMQHFRELLDERTTALRGELAALRTLLDERYATQTKALDAAFVAAEKAVSTALDSAEKAVAKAELAAERRFESVNEFREQLADQAGTFVTKAEQDAVNTGLTDRLTRAEQTAERSAGHNMGTSAARAALYAGIGVVATVILVGIAILTFNN